jgi:hypothetical protein
MARRLFLLGLFELSSWWRQDLRCPTVVIASVCLRINPLMNLGASPARSCIISGTVQKISSRKHEHQRPARVACGSFLLLRKQAEIDTEIAPDEAEHKALTTNH